MVNGGIRVRSAADRGVAELGWLSSRHTFSFGEYFDADYLGFRSLRVINDDRVQPGQGFGMHPHRDMEILSVVVEGALEHRDSLGSGSILRPGEVQRMTAGSGILHSEFNPSNSAEVRFLQVWIEPETRGLRPSYEQRRFPVEGCEGQWVLVASREGSEGSLRIHQDVAVYRGVLGPHSRLEHVVRPDRAAWIQIISGSAEVGGRRLHEGDGAAVEVPGLLTVSGAGGRSDVLLFDLI